MFLIFCQKFLCSESVPTKTILHNNDWHNITGYSSNQFNSLGSCRCRLVVLSTPKSSSYQGFPQIEHERGIQYSHIMERYSINRIYIFHSFFFDSVALKGIFLFLNFWAWVKVFHSYSALNRAQHVPCDTKGHRKLLLVIQCDYMQLSVQKDCHCQNGTLHLSKCTHLTVWQFYWLQQLTHFLVKLSLA